PDPPAPSRWAAVDRAAQALQVLAGLCGVPELGHRIAARQTIKLTWSGNAVALERAFAREISALEKDWSRLVDALRAQRLVDAEALRDARPTLAIEIDDRRADCRQPLPELRHRCSR